MRVLLRAAFHLSTLRDAGVNRVAIAVDHDTGINVEDVVLLLRPWRPWLEITDVFILTNADTDDGWLDLAASQGAQAVSIITERAEFANPLVEAVGRRGLLTLTSDYPTGSERATALFHEMSHHHFELGGFNEWNESPSLHGAHLLQHISAANCITHFPQYAISELRTKRATLGRALEALDVGSGAISRLRWGALQGLLHISGVDPLLDVYEILLAYHGLDRLPSIRVDRAIAAGAEALESHVASESVDFAYCCNALDHVEDPPTVIAQIARTLRPGATFALEFATREGSRQDWQQLHQFDLFLDVDRHELICQRQDARPDALLPEGVPLTLDRVVVATDVCTVVVLRRD